MNEISFENECFKSERLSDGTVVVTILKDNFNFLGINLKGCKLITDNNGFIADEFTTNSVSDMTNYLSTYNCEFKDLTEIKIELRNRMMNVLISQLFYH